MTGVEHGRDLAEAIRREAERLDQRHEDYASAGAATVVDRVRIALCRLARAIDSPAATGSDRPDRSEGVRTYVDIVFDGPPDSEAGRFVEVENERGESIRFGEWVLHPDGYWALRVATPPAEGESQAATEGACRRHPDSRRWCVEGQHEIGNPAWGSGGEARWTPAGLQAEGEASHVHDETCDIDWDVETERRLGNPAGSWGRTAAVAHAEQRAAVVRALTTAWASGPDEDEAGAIADVVLRALAATPPAPAGPQAEDPGETAGGER